MIDFLQVLCYNFNIYCYVKKCGINNINEGELNSP